VSSPQERLYEIAADALDRQRQAIDSARSAIPAVVPAAAVIGGALAKAAFAAPGTFNMVCAVAGAAGAVVVLVFGVLTFAPPRHPNAVALSFSVQGLEEQTRAVMGESGAFHVALARYFNALRQTNEKGVREIRRRLTVTLSGLAAEAAGFLLATVVHF